MICIQYQLDNAHPLRSTLLRAVNMTAKGVGTIFTGGGSLGWSEAIEGFRTLRPSKVAGFFVGHAS